MEVIKHTKFIWQYLNVFDNNLCDHVREECLEHLHYNDMAYKRDRNHIVQNDSYNLSFESRQNPNLFLRKKLWDTDQKVNDVYSKVQDHYCSNNALFQYTLSNLSVIGFNTEYHFRHYSKNDLYHWHCDLHYEKTFVLSGILYLNDDFGGGGTRFLMDKLTVQPIKNSMLFFPCGPYFIHKSVPIKYGEKTIIWSCFDAVCEKP